MLCCNLLPTHSNHPGFARSAQEKKLDKFGKGRWREKIAILLTAAVLVCFGASYRAGTSWKTPVPRTQPLPGYYHKAAFYIVNFTVEVLTVYLYGAVRVDLRFHVPDGAKARKSYKTTPGEKDLEDQDSVCAQKDERGSSFGRVFSEEETFDDDQEKRNGDAMKKLEAEKKEHMNQQQETPRVDSVPPVANTAPTGPVVGQAV